MSDLELSYQERYTKALQPLAQALERQLQEYLEGEPRIDRVNARAKSVDRFMTKANKIEDKKQKYSEPLHQIQDQIGARIITFYRSDIDRVSKIILKYFRPIEAKDMVPESEWEFGYFGRHFVLILPSDLVSSSIDKNLVPQFFELQIKTLFQHAWSEADHDLGYKPQSAPLPPGALRRLAYTSAQAWGADLMLEELFQESTQS